MSVIRHPSTGTAVTVKQWRYIATGGETTLSGTDGFGLSLSYTVGAEEVYINGVLLVRGTDYTASTGTSITGLTALVAGDVATVMSANSFNVANAIAASTVTAKGDLIVANGASSVSNLAVGADGTTLVANSSSSTGVAWAGPIATAGKNAVINGGFDIWQRGTSVASSTGVYTADRWLNYFAATGTVTRQATNDTTNLPNIQYCARIQRTSGQTATSAMYFAQNMETVNSIPFAGKTVTLSFYARAGANYSSTSNVLQVYLNFGTGTDQNIITGTYTGNTSVITQNATLTTTWQRFSYTGTVASTTTELATYFQYAPTGTAGAADYYEITGVQLEQGSVATAFSRAGGTVQGELAACQRYFIAYSGDASVGAMSAATTTSVNRMTIATPTAMRTTPSASYTGTIQLFDGATAINVSSLGTTWLTQNTIGQNFNVASGLTQYRTYQCYINFGTLLFSAEL